MLRRRVKGPILFLAVMPSACALNCVTPEAPADSTSMLHPYSRYVFQRTHDAPTPRPTYTKPSPRRRVPVSNYDRAWLPSRGRISERWTTIVIHHSATDRGGATEFDKFHKKKGWDELGYHFVIGNGTDTPDGYVEVGARWHKQKHGAHCKTPGNYYNEHGIGVCIVGDFTRTSPSRKQLASLNRLTRFLSDRCGISPRRVTTHGAITGKTKCPGRRFNLAKLRRVLATTPTASSLP